jgi:dihydrofolate synthase/folylpolyglutamate synthase
MKSPLISMPHWPLVPLNPLEGDPLLRMERLLEAIGDPHVSLPPTIHVSGTNGKGSTIAFLRAMFEAAGYSVHTYTSPHLMRFEERIVLRGNEIRPSDLHMLLEEVRIANRDQPVDFFEGTTAAAMLAFARVPADILLMESGLGGGFDPTNVLFNPRLSILTSISLDHVPVLGNSVPEIALAEAGILRSNTPCVMGAQPDDAAAVIRAMAERKGTLLYEYGAHWRSSHDGEALMYQDANGTAYLPRPALLGDHQALNAGNAIAAITLLNEFHVGAEHIEAGLLNASWPGRLEHIAMDLPEGFELWFDGGHNISGAEVIADFISKNWADKPTHLITGTTRGKDASPMLAAFKEAAASIYTVPVQAEVNCYSANEMQAFAQKAGFSDVTACESVASAVQHIVNNHEVGRILVFGSLFFRAELV